MNFSIKKTLPLWILFFTCFFLRGAEATEEISYLTDCSFSGEKDSIKVKLVFAEGTIANCTLFKIKNRDPKGVSVRIKNDQLAYLETFYQLVDIEVHAVPSHEEDGVVFEVIENLERIPTDKQTLKDTLTNTSKYFVKTDSKVKFRNDILPKLTYSGSRIDTKYIRFFTKP